MYKNYVQRLLFLPNMVTEVMYLAINVYLDGGKPGTSGGFNIKEVISSRWWTTFDYHQLLGWGH